MGKSILIAYFSRAGNNYVNGTIKKLQEGNTEVAAKKMNKILGTDFFKINPVKKYSEDYHICTEEAKYELRTNARPELSEKLNNIDGYETIILGYPNWWGTMPMPVRTFLESYDFSGKTILPFCTHEGSGMGNSENDIKLICPDSKVQKGLSIHGGSVGSSEKDIEAWLKKNALL